ncbi:hypothetical protein [Rubrivirga sp. IMCC45206]|uniref:hypothetical protein n=1 Tax=Rubrivirga sp. IMCC45206 TaxID=3391614 RepID=UPI00399035C5
MTISTRGRMAGHIATALTIAAGVLAAVGLVSASSGGSTKLLGVVLVSLGLAIRTLRLQKARAADRSR